MYGMAAPASHQDGRFCALSRAQLLLAFAVSYFGIRSWLTCAAALSILEIVSKPRPLQK